MNQTTLGKIQSKHGCKACKHRREDDQLDAHDFYWCNKAEGVMGKDRNNENSVGCTDWALVTEKEIRQSYISEAVQLRLPGGE